MWIPLILTSLVCIGSRFAEAQNMPSCASKLTSCVQYLNSADIPPSSCCDPLTEAFAEEKGCMYNFIGTSGLLESFGSNVTQLFQIIHSCNITLDTLKQGDTLNSTQLMLSANGTFSLGFLQNNHGSYLAIWGPYGGPPVWIANRDSYASTESASLIIDSQGMSIINEVSDPFVLYHNETLSKSTNMSATLLENGNLVLRLLKSDGSVERTLWQSFDYPTDTLLPGMKLGVDHQNDKNWSLTSWLDEDAPDLGPFTLDWDPKQHQLVLKLRGVIFWTSGALKNQTFEPMWEYYNLTRKYGLMSTANSDEQFFHYTSMPDEIFYWRINYLGALVLNDTARIRFQDFCDGYNTDGGCAQWKQPQCRSDKLIFDLLAGSFSRPPEIFDYSPDFSGSVGPADCRHMCWNNCDCLGYDNTSDVGCQWYNKTLKFQADPSGAAGAKFVIRNRTEPSPLAFSKTVEGTPARKKWIWISILITLPLLAIIVIFFCVRRKYKGKETKDRKDEHALQLMTADRLANANEVEYGDYIVQNLRVFSLESITQATDNFTTKLGEGGFGPVYKGQLPEGAEIAVKRLSRSSGQGLMEFKNELILIAKLQHMNLVRLLGCCLHGDEKMLVYEYMLNKSLDSFLFHPSKRWMIDWRKRVSIIEGIAQGLLYLHQHSRLRIIHRDLKASNVLLDADMNPKISDFGMARIFNRNELMANTHRIVGTYGYMSPEYAFQGIFSVKSDVFSFGVLMLEILSGRKNNSFYDINKPMTLVGFAWELWQKGAGLELMDSTLKDSCSTLQFLRILHVGLLCVEDSPGDRPTISEVISMITTESIVLPFVKKPAFLNLDRVSIEDSQRNQIECNSVNDVSISTLVAR